MLPGAGLWTRRLAASLNPHGKGQCYPILQMTLGGFQRVTLLGQLQTSIFSPLSHAVLTENALSGVTAGLIILSL